jgi:malonate-semialdehyde dehydrogenase (acetylating)/methylmalonate-semialdehyde dehydrogenase
VQALGGAKNHMVVMPDADLDAAADAAVSAAYGSAGERCMAVSVSSRSGRRRRRPRREDRRAHRGLKIGRHGCRERDGPAHHPRAPRQGGLLRRRRRRRGATVVVDGTRRFEGDGFFIGVSLVDHVAPGMKVYDEIFGPVLSVVRVATYDEAVALINATRSATAPRSSRATAAPPASSSSTSRSAWSASTCRSRCRSARSRSAAGSNSLFGDSHIYGPESIHFYTRSKVVTTRWPDPSEPDQPRLPEQPLSPRHPEETS